jgi:ATP-dependent helicase Lhr and Lhr-like helicase
VAQIGAPWSVAGLRQRLGRSGRRGKSAVIRLYIAERACPAGLHPVDALRLDLVQSIAMVRLLVAGWCEPPRLGALHLSTLVHQILALIAQGGGASAARAYRTLCREGPFRAVTPSLFAEVLRSIGAPEVRLIEQAVDGILLLGEVGERMVASYDFYAVFETLEEYRVICDGKALGTLPIVTVVVPEMSIIFSGRRWRVIEVQQSQKTIVVVPARTGVPPPVGGDGGDLHDTVVAEMRRVYHSNDVPIFLDQTARELLVEARNTYREFGLARRAILETDGATHLFPWTGTAAANTLALALKDAGLPAAMRRTIIEVEGTPAEAVRGALERLAAGPLPAPVRLAHKVANLERGKYDRFLPTALLAIGFAADRLVPDALSGLARTIIANRSVLKM